MRVIIRTLTIIIIIVLLLFSFVIQGFSMDDTDGFHNVIAFANFEDGNLPSTFDYKTDDYVYPPEVVAAPIGEGRYGKVVRLHTMGRTDKSDHFFRTKYSLINSGYTSSMLTGEALEKVQLARFSCDIMMGEYTNVSVASVCHQSLTNRPYVNYISFYDNGMYRLINGTTGNYEKNKWYTIVVYANFVNNTYTIYLDNELLAGDISMGTQAYNYALSFGARLDRTNTDDFVYLDNIRYNVLGKPVLNSVKTSNPRYDFPIRGGSVEFIFSTRMSPVEKSDISITRDGKSVDLDYEVLMQGEKIILMFNENLDFSSNYVVKVKSGIKDYLGQPTSQEYSVSFSTGKPSVFSTRPVISDGQQQIIKLNPQGDIYASTQVYNMLDKTAAATLIVAAYDDNNNMLTYNSVTKDISSQSSEELTAALNLDLYPYTSYVKAFTLDDINKLNLICSEFAYVTTEDVINPPVIEGSSTGIILNDLEVVGNRFTVTGKSNNGKAHTVLLKISSPSGTYLITPLYTDENGMFSYSFVLDNDAEEGEYVISVKGKNIAESADKTLYYIAEGKIIQFLADINSAKSARELETIIIPSRKIFNMAEKYFNDNAYVAVYENLPYNSLDEVRDIFILAFDVLENINTANWSSLNEYYSKYEKLIFNGIEAYNKYKTFSQTKAAKVNQEIVNLNRFQTFLEFRRAFSDIVSKVDSPESGGSKGNGKTAGGGGGLKSGYTVAYPANQTSETKTNKTGEEETGEKNKTVFIDMNEAPWAEKAVNELYKKGIVLGDGDKRFRPNDEVKREEFVKMLVSALGILNEGQESTFEDVEKDKWYYPYIAAAQAVGLVTGDGSGRFGIGQNITRQDMAVLVYRAGQIMNKNISGKQTPLLLFKDDADISDYAKEAVYALLGANLISGVGDGLFAPSVSASKAQAAIMIYNLIMVQEAEEGTK